MARLDPPPKSESVATDERARAATYPVHTKEDPHLRSTEDVTGYEVWAKDGEIGRLENFIVDEASWHIGYLDVKTGDWLHSRSMMVPTDWVTSVSWADHRVNLDHAQKQV